MDRRASLKRLTAEAFWVGSGIFFSNIGTLLGVRLLTSVMLPEEYGRLALGVSVAMALVYCIGMALWGTITRFFSVAQEDGDAKWYWQSIRRALRSSSKAFFLLGALVALVLKVAGFSYSESWFWFLAILFGGIQVVGETGSALQSGARNRKIFSLHQNLINWGRFLVAYWVVQCGFSGATGAMLGFVISGVMVMISQRYWVKKKILADWATGEDSKNRSESFSNYFKPLAYSGILIWIPLFVDRWILNTYGALKDVGVYFALYQISFAPALLCSNFLLHLSGPIFFNKAGDGSDSGRLRTTAGLNGKIAGLILILLTVLVGIAFWIGDRICFLLIDPNYQYGFWAFPWLIASGGMYSVGQQLLISIYSGINTRVMIPFRLITAVLAVACYLTGCRLYGYSGLIGGGVLFSLFFLSLSFWMHHRSMTHSG